MQCKIKYLKLCHKQPHALLSDVMWFGLCSGQVLEITQQQPHKHLEQYDQITELLPCQPSSVGFTWNFRCTSDIFFLGFS